MLAARSGSRDGFDREEPASESAAAKAAASGAIPRFHAPDDFRNVVMGGACLLNNQNRTFHNQ